MHSGGLPPGISVFEEYWERYDSWYARHRFIAESEVRAVEASLKEAPRPVVEIGVGTGFFAHKLHVDLGVDPAFNMLKAAKAKGVQVIQGVGEKPPLRACSAGTVLIIVTLCFASDPRDLLRGAAGILRRGGRMVSCIVPRDSAWGEKYTRLAEQGDVFYSAARFYTVSEVDRMYREAGVKSMGCWSTLSYGPEDKPRLEEPLHRCSGGFVCMIGVKE